MRSASSRNASARCDLWTCTWYAVMSLEVNAFSRPPAAAMSFEYSPEGTALVPLNIMCSSTCATPVVPLNSSMLPALYHTIATTVGAR